MWRLLINIQKPSKQTNGRIFIFFIFVDWFYVLLRFSSIFTFLMGVSSVVLVRGIVSVCCKKDEEDEFTQVRVLSSVLYQQDEKMLYLKDPKE